MKKNQPAPQPETSTDDDYFNITAIAVGYVTKITLKREGREESIKVRLNLLTGKKTEVKYVPAELYVHGQAALNLIKSLNDRRSEEDKVLISFLGNVYPSYYISRAENSAGQIISTFSGSMNHIKSIKENGTFTHREESDRSSRSAKK